MSVNYAWAPLLLFLMASRLLSILICALLSGATGAAELGDAQVRSYIGQPLVADIELTELDAPGSTVQARLAHPNVYRGANLGMPHVLTTLNMSVTQRDGRQFLRVTSPVPVESSRLHLYLELADGGQRNVRLVTLPMAPNPNPPPPTPLPPPAPVRPVTPQPVEAAAPAFVAPKPPPRPRPAPAARPVVVAKAEPAPEALPEPKPKPTVKPVPEPEPKPVAAALLPPPAAQATCVAASDVDRSTVCAALDYKGAQLREQIGQLEDKVRVLQVALGANPATVSAPRSGDPAKAHSARRRAAPEPEASTPWGWIAGGIVVVLALVGGAFVLLRRRKRPGRIAPIPGVPLMTRLRQRFARKKPARQAVEPKLEATEQEMSTQV